MVSEIMLFASASSQATHSQGAGAKARAVGSDGAFQALMSLALSAFLGGGPGNEAPVVEGDAAEGAPAPDVARVTLNREGAGVPWVAQGFDVSVESEGQHAAPKPADSGTHDVAKGKAVAGPVEAQYVAAETGRYTGHWQTAGAAKFPAAARGEGEVEIPSGSERAFGPGVAIKATPEVAAAPVYAASREEAIASRQQVVVPAVVVPTVDAGTETAGSQMARRPEGAFASGERPAVARTGGQGGGAEAIHVEGAAKAVAAPAAVKAASPEAVTPEEVAPEMAAPETVAAGRSDRAPMEEQSEGVASVTPGNRATKQFKAAPLEDRPVTDVEEAAPEANVVQAANEPAGRAETADEPQGAFEQPLKSAREISRTLFEESLKRLPRSVEIRIDPPQMGSVTALLSQRGQDVTVKFVAHSGQAQRMLEGATEDLAKALSEKGLVLTGFSVDPGFGGKRGQERRGDTGRPAQGRYIRAARLGAVAAGSQVRQTAGAFNWLA